MSESSPGREGALGAGRRSRRASRITFTLSRGSVPLIGAGLLVSWALAYGLGRRAVGPEAPSAAPAGLGRPPGGTATALPAAVLGARSRVPPAPAATTTAAETRESAVSLAADAPEADARADAPLVSSEVVPRDGFGIQIGAYRDRAEAEAAVSELHQELEGLDVFLIPVDIPGKGTWYRVRLGHFATRQAAEARRLALSVAAGALSLPYK